MIIESLIGWGIAKLYDTAFGRLILRPIEKRFPKFFRNKTKEIVDLYEGRIEKKNSEIQQLERAQAEREREHAADQERVDRSLRRRSVSVEKLIERYHKPLRAVLISYATQKERIRGGIRSSHFVKDELNRFNSKYLGGGDSIIPPRSVPGEIRNQHDLENWFNEEILKGRYCKLKFLVLFDIRNHAFWGTFLPYTQRSPRHWSIGEVLKAGDIFTDDQIRTIAIGDIISAGDIAWLASTVLSGDELQVVLQNQEQIEKALDRPSLRILSGESMAAALSGALDGFVQNPAEVANAIIEEARFWNQRLRN